MHWQRILFLEVCNVVNVSQDIDLRDAKAAKTRDCVRQCMFC